MLIVVTFIVNAALNFALGLAVAAVLGPEAYGRFSVAFMGATVATTLVFDWLRLSATRFYNARTRQEQPEIRAALDAGYVTGVLAVIAFTGLALALGLDFGLGWRLVAATAAAAIANAGFEFSAALLRARFHNRGYSELVLLKNALTFVGMIGVGAATRDPALVMLMAAGGAAVAVAALWPRTADRAAGDRAPHLRVYLRYGAPIVVAAILYQIIVLANRAVVAGRMDFSAAGELSLATDVTIRLILVAGAAMDVLLFQLAAQKKATEGTVAAQRQVARNTLMIVAALTLLCLGYMADMPAFAALVAPEKFRNQFAPLSLILAPGVTLFALGQFCLNPIAQLEGRTGRVLVAAVATAALDLGGLAFAPRDLPLAYYAWLHSASLAAGALIMLGLTAPWRAYWPRARDLGAIALSGASALVAMWPLRELQPKPLALAMVALAGASVYFAALYLSDPGGLVRPAVSAFRARLALRIGRRSASRPSP